MADDQIRAYDRQGNKVMVPKDQIGKLYALGGRVATRDEQNAHDAAEKQAAAEAAVEARYGKLAPVQKALGVVNTVAGAATGNPLLVGGDPNAPPVIAAYGGGVRQGLTAGMYDAGMRQMADAVGGKKAGDAYAQQVEQQQTASPIAHGVGDVVGMTAGAFLGGEAGAARAVPTAGITALGEIAEQGAGRALAGLAERGALGRAAATAGEFGARGAVEGGLYGATQAASDALLKDQELSADKIFAQSLSGAALGGLGGAGLGAAGSLVKSGAQSALQGLGGVTINGGGLQAAARSKANELAFDALGATKGQALSAIEHVHGGAEAVGEYVNRVAIKPATNTDGLIGGTLKAAMGGRADNLLEVIQADKYGRIKDGIDAAIKAHPARMSLDAVEAVGRSIYDGMRKDPTKVAGAEAFLTRITQEADAVSRAGMVAADGTVDAAQAFKLRSDMAKQAYELGRTSGAAGDAYKTYLKEWDRASIQALDDAAAAAGKTGHGDEIRYWKREWQLASAAEELAEHGSDRAKLNNIIGLRAGVGAAVGIATGHPLLATASGLGMKMLHERGAAAGAFALGKMADLTALTQLVAKTNNQIAAASRGLLTAPAKGALPAPSSPPRLVAQQAMRAIAAMQADPEGTMDKIAGHTDGINAASPELGASIAQRHAQALSFLASKVPVAPDKDPLDPHPAPRMTDAEAATFARYAWYAEKPSRFFEEVAKGKLTPEGAETAAALMPRAFAELQQRTLDAIATHMSRGRSIPFQQRLKIGSILDIPAVPSQRPEHMLMLQQNVQPAPGDLQSKPAPSRRSAGIPTQRSALDRLEAGGPGR